MMVSRKRRVVGYVRVSVDADDKASPDMQREAITALCHAKGWTLVDVVEERGRSAGEGKKRPGLDRARTMIASRAADTLMVWKIDRCSRSVRDFAILWSGLRDLGAEFVSVTESFDTSSSIGRAMLQISMVFAELERERSVERTTGWHEYRVANAMTPTGKAPLGYVRNGRNELHLDDKVAPVVRRVALDLVEGRTTVRAGAKHLTAHGHPISHHGLRTALQSPTLAGGRRVDGVFVPGTWPALLDVDLHQRLVTFFADPSRRTRPDDAQRRWVLAGIATCGVDVDGHTCGAPLTSKPNKGRVRYFCPTNHLSVDAAGLDLFVAGMVLAAVDADTWTALRRRGSPQPAPVDIASVEADLADLAARYARGDLRRVEWDAARTVLLERLEAAESPAAGEVLDLPDVDDLGDAWEGLSVDARRLVIAAVLDNVTVRPTANGGPAHPADRVELTWRV
jgi:DNA invertase Pin-like site-specific DNA recombinase